MMQKENRLLRTGILGCGPIAQFAHLEACQKARNATLYALCDAATDLLQEMTRRWKPERSYADYDAMLADPDLEAVIVATSDAFHESATRRAIEAGKHVLVEKPLGTSLAGCAELLTLAEQKGVRVQVGHMKRFDPGIAYARKFIEEEMGELMALKAWYGDSTHRYTVTDNVQPLPIRSDRAIRPAQDEKADRSRYFMLAHGSHLLDTAAFLGGPIGSVKARLVTRFGAYCWFVHTEMVSGAVGHLDLTIPVRGDWHEGFQIYGEKGSIIGKTYNPWYFRGSDVECFSETDATYRRVLGADAHFYRLQLESFADAVIRNIPQKGTTLAEGREIVKGMLAIRQSVLTGRTVYLDTITEGEL